ncbi:MAG: class I SAM-dependent methyltransferase [Bacteroidota bacterium]
MQCAGCELISLSPQPTRSVLSRHYPADYYTHTRPRLTIKNSLALLAREISYQVLGGTGIPAHRSPLKILFTTMLRNNRYLNDLANLDSLPFLRRGAEVLEVGFGSAAFLDFLVNKGMRCRGVETDPAVVGLARAKGHDVFAGELEQVRFPPETFDFIRMRHVLEHVRNPRVLLGEAHRIQKTGGYLHIEVPNAAGLLAKTFRDRWVQLEAPRHLYHFGPKTLRDLVTRCGYEVASMNFNTEPWHLLGSLQYGLNELRTESAKGQSRDRDFWEDGRLSSMLRKLARRINATGFGENIILLARKPESLHSHE